MLKYDFNKVALHGYSSVNLLDIFRATFPVEHLWRAASAP